MALLMNKKNGIKLFVGGFAPETTQDDLERYFEQFSLVLHIRIEFGKKLKLPKCYGYVTVPDMHAVNRILTYGEHVLEGKKIDVEIAKDKRKRGNKKLCQHPIQSADSSEPLHQRMVTGAPPTSWGAEYVCWERPSTKRHLLQQMTPGELLLPYDQGSSGSRGSRPSCRDFVSQQAISRPAYPREVGREEARPTFNLFNWAPTRIAWNSTNQGSQNSNDASKSQSQKYPGTHNSKEYIEASQAFHHSSENLRFNRLGFKHLSRGRVN